MPRLVDDSGACISAHQNVASALFGGTICAVCGLTKEQQEEARRRAEDAMPSGPEVRRHADARMRERVAACGRKPGGHRWYLDYGTGLRCPDCGVLRRDLT